MVILDAHLGAPIEVKLFQGLFGKLEPTHAVNENGFTVSFTRQANDRTDLRGNPASNCLWRFASYRFRARTPIANSDSAVYRGGYRDIVCHCDNGQAKLAAQCAQELKYLAGRNGIKLPGWLIGQQQLWLIGNGYGNGSALLLAAGDLVWPFPVHTFHADQFQQLARMA